MQQTITIPNIKQLPRIPEKGVVYLSVNLALADPGTVWDLAKQLGFNPQLAYLQTRIGIEIHALLHQGELQTESLVEGHGLEEQVESLMDKGINPDSIRLVYGRGQSLNVA